MRPSTKHRGFCFTWNNYPEDWRVKLEAIDTLYCVAGEEKAPTTGTPHLQGYIKFKSQRTLRAVVKELAKQGISAHISSAKGTPVQNRVYCTKVLDFLVNKK